MLSNLAPPPDNLDTNSEGAEGTRVNLQGRLVIVTGASGALGAGVSEAFVRAGATVIGVVHNPPRERLPEVRYEVADLTQDESIAELFASVPAPWAVINTVGGFAPQRPLRDFDAGEFTTQYTLNLLSAALLTKHALRVMLPTNSGRIVHTASRAATHPSGAGFAYSVSKAGVLHLVQMAAAEARDTKIRVNAVSPAIIDSPANRAAMPTANHAAWPTPEQLAHTYLFLADPASDLVNGAVLPV